MKTAIGMLIAGMSVRDVAFHFQRHEVTISILLNRFQQTGNVADRPRSGRLRKTMQREDRFLMTSSRRNRFLSSQKLGRLLRNASGQDEGRGWAKIMSSNMNIMGVVA